MFCATQVMMEVNQNLHKRSRGGPGVSDPPRCLILSEMSTKLEVQGDAWFEDQAHFGCDLGSQTGQRESNHSGLCTTAGQWQMLVNVINKHGVLPKAYFPESWSSEASLHLGWILNAFVSGVFSISQGRVQLRRGRSNGELPPPQLWPSSDISVFFILGATCSLCASPFCRFETAASRSRICSQKEIQGRRKQRRLSEG